MVKTEISNVSSQPNVDAVLRAQRSNSWGKTPGSISGQSAAELEFIASDCCQCNTNPRSTKA